MYIMVIMAIMVPSSRGRMRLVQMLYRHIIRVRMIGGINRLHLLGDQEVSAPAIDDDYQDKKER